MTVKFLTATYLLGAAVFASAIVVILLALAGVNTIGRRVPLAYPIVGGFAVMLGAKVALRLTLRKAEGR